MNRFSATSKRFGEHIAEWAIRIVASISILVIFLIFLFVFKEATGLFTSTAPTQTAAQAAVSASTSSADHQQDVYNPDESADTSATATPSNANDQDVYNPDATIEETAQKAAPSSTTTEVVEAPKSLWEKLRGSIWQPVSEDPKFGLVPLFIGTAKTTIVAIVIGAPLGILAALYTAFFASPRVRNIVKPVIELLAGFPSVVIGFFCLTIVATFLQDILGTAFRLNALVGGFGLSLAVIPLVFSIAEESLTAVPGTLREASLALGSTEWQTAYRVMLPAAAPGVFAAVLLGVGRAFGETMIALMATGNAAMKTWSVFEPARTFAATIGSEMGEVVWGSEHYGVLFLLGSMLFLFSFGLNAVTELYVKSRLIKKFQGK